MPLLLRGPGWPGSSLVGVVCGKVAMYVLAAAVVGPLLGPKQRDPGDHAAVPRLNQFGRLWLVVVWARQACGASRCLPPVVAPLQSHQGMPDGGAA